MAIAKKYVVNVKWEPNVDRGRVAFDLEDLGCLTIKEWDSLSELERQKKIQQALDSHQDQPFAVLDTYSVKNKDFLK